MALSPAIGVVIITALFYNLEFRTWFSNAVKEAVSNKKIKKSIEEDINATFLKDPACNMYIQPILFYKGFMALQAYRVGNFWIRDKLGFSLYIQSMVSELYGVDIHPNSKIGCGIMIDHATGIVIGETAELGDNSIIFHGVTLGGVGSDKEKRHPKVGKNVLLSANSTILGDIKVGDNVKIGSGSVVLKDLPDKVEQTIYLPMLESQKAFYDGFIQEVHGLLNDYEKKKSKQHFQVMALTLLMRLRQICVSPALIDEEYTELTPKYIFLKERLHILQNEGYSALVFSQFTKSLDIIEKMCQDEGFSYYRLDGKTPIKKRKKCIDAFQNSNDPEFFIISLKAGGLGLNLTKASYVFHMDPWWNPAVEVQATDRTHRIGQEKNVFSFRLAMCDTIEEKILKMNENKLKLFNLFFKDSSLVKRKAGLTAQDLQYLIG